MNLDFAKIADFFKSPFAFFITVLFMLGSAWFLFIVGDFFQHQQDAFLFFLSFVMWGLAVTAPVLFMVEWTGTYFTATPAARFKAALGFGIVLLIATLPLWGLAEALGSALTILTAGIYGLMLLMLILFVAICNFAYGIVKNPVLKFIVAFLLCLLVMAVLEPLIAPVFIGEVIFSSLFLVVSLAALFGAGFLIVGDKTAKWFKGLEMLCVIIIFVSLNSVAPVLDKYASFTTVAHHSLTSQSTELLARNGKPVALTLYMPVDFAAQNPAFALYAKAIENLLADYKAAGKGTVIITNSSSNEIKPLSVTVAIGEESAQATETAKAAKDWKSTKTVFLEDIYPMAELEVMLTTAIADALATTVDFPLLAEPYLSVNDDNKMGLMLGSSLLFPTAAFLIWLPYLVLLRRNKNA